MYKYGSPTRLLNLKEKLEFYRREHAKSYDILAMSKTVSRMAYFDNLIKAAETDYLKEVASAMAIDMPKDEDLWETVSEWDKVNWVELDAKDTWGDIKKPESKRKILTRAGKAKLNRLIREAKRQDIAWWFKIIGAIVASLTGLAGTIAAIIALLLK